MSESQRYSQARKETAASAANQVPELLAEYFDVPDSRVVCVEDELNGRYDTSELTPVQLLDFACIDWLVDARPEIIPIAQRITPVSSRGRFSIRTDNGTEMPCEGDVLPSDGLVPLYYLFGRSEDNSLSRAWLLDAQQTVTCMQDSPQSVTIQNDDGTEAMYLELAELALSGCVVEGWQL